MFTMTINQIIDSMCNALDASTLVVDAACAEAHARATLAMYDARLAEGLSLEEVLEGDSWS